MIERIHILKFAPGNMNFKLSMNAVYAADKFLLNILSKTFAIVEASLATSI